MLQELFVAGRKVYTKWLHLSTFEYLTKTIAQIHFGDLDFVWEQKSTTSNVSGAYVLSWSAYKSIQ